VPTTTFSPGVSTISWEVGSEVEEEEEDSFVDCFLSEVEEEEARAMRL
jgi:hypothetical protein